jgi:glyoxylase I family protein
MVAGTSVAQKTARPLERPHRLPEGEAMSTRAQVIGAKSQAATALRLHGVRYQTADVGRAVGFYTTHLGFTLQHEHLPEFAVVALADFQLLLSGPGASGSRPMPDSTPQKPGGWNRIVLRVTDLHARIDELKQDGVTFRNTMETGPAGSQIQVEDPDGNPIELFEPAH